MQSETDAIIRSLGDMLLQLGCDSGWLIPNTTLSTKSLNSAIATYQSRLDALELEVSQALVSARAKKQVPEPEPEPEPEMAPEPEEIDLSGDLNSSNGQFVMNNDLGNDIAIDLTSPINNVAVDGSVQGGFIDQDFDPTQNNIGDEFDFTNMNGAADNFGIYDELNSAGMAKLDDGYGLLDDQF